MIWGWFNSAEAVDLGSRMAMAIVARVGSAGEADRKMLNARTRDALGGFSLELERYKRTSNPSFYQKAKMANTLRKKLAEAGFDKHYIEDVVRWLIMRLS